MKERGITTMTLVITVIVLSIVAGVSISFLVGDNGLINRANAEKSNFDASVVKSNIKLAVLKANENGGITEQNLTNALNNKIGEGQYTLTKNNETNVWIITVGSLKYSVTTGGTVSEIND